MGRKKGISRLKVRKRFRSNSRVASKLKNNPTLAGQVYLSGMSVWSCLIAFYRIVYIKKQNWIDSFLGDKKFLTLLLLTGAMLSFSMSYFLAFYDYEGVNIKLCTQFSKEDIETLQLIKVL